MAKKMRGNGVLGDAVTRPVADPRAWANSHGTYLAGRAYLDEADRTAIEMEAKWGVDRLRLLVGPELRLKFDRQRYLLNRAIWHGELEDVRQQSTRMVAAWRKLDFVAAGNGSKPLDPMVWEVAVGDGEDVTVAAIVPDNHHAHRVVAEGRRMAVYTLEEIGRLLQAMPAIAKAKQTWPGATVTVTRKTVDDPLDGIPDTLDDVTFRCAAAETLKPLEDTIDDPGAFAPWPGVADHAGA